MHSSALRLALPLALALPLSSLLPPQAPGNRAPAAQAPEDPYPPARVETQVRFFILDGEEVDRGKLDGALAGLGETARVAYGPVNTSSRPDDWFVAIESPAKADGKAVSRAAKKGTGRAEQLVVTGLLYDPEDLQVPTGGRRAAGSVRDLVIGMADEVRWVDITPTVILFFHEASFDAEDVIDRFDKLRSKKPRSNHEGDLLKHSAVWRLAMPPGEEAKKSKLRKLEKTIAKMPGVAKASIDPDLLRLFLTFRVENLPVSGPGLDPPERAAEEEGAPPGGGGGGGGRGGPGGGRRAALPGDRIPFLPRVDVNPLIEAIEKAGLIVEDEGGSGSGG